MHRVIISALLVIGCGGGGSGDSDAADPVADAAADANVAPGPCGLRASDSSLPSLAGYPVFFSSPDGTLLGEATTSADGAASFDECVADTMVSISVQAVAGPAVFVFTYGGVMPGDTVFVGLPAAADPASSLSVTLSTVADPSAADYRWTAGDGCNSGLGTVLGTPGMTVLEPQCLGDNPGTIDVLARAIDAGEITAFDTASDISVVNGGTTVVDFDGWDPPTTSTLSIAGLPEAGGNLESSLRFYRDGVELLTETNSESIAGPTASLAASIPAGDFLQVQRWGATVRDGAGGARSVLVSGAVGDLSVDLATELPPRLAGVLFSLADPARPELTLVADGDINDATAHGSVMVFMTGTQTVFWAMIRPSRIAGPIRLPELPSSLSAQSPANAMAIPAVGGGAFWADGVSYPALLAAGVTPQDILASNLRDGFPAAFSVRNATASKEVTAP